MLANGMIRTLPLVAALALWAGCNGTKAGGNDDGRYGNDPNGSSGGAFDPDAGPRPPLVRDGGAEDTRSLFQSKSAAQVTASIVQCVGAGKTMVLADMIQSDPPPTCFEGAENGACAFLTGGLFTAGVDVVSSQTRTFDGAESATRQGTRPDQLGVEVLTALQSVAGVVASNCLRAADPLCACNTHDTARAMVARCLPSFDPATPEYEAAAAALETKCATAPGAAVASMLASYAFLRVN